MVERIGKKEGKLLAKDELKRAEEEIKSAKMLLNLQCHLLMKLRRY